jgi:hypothetical protein
MFVPMHDDIHQAIEDSLMGLAREQGAKIARMRMALERISRGSLDDFAIDAARTALAACSASKEGRIK